MNKLKLLSVAIMGVLSFSGCGEEDKRTNTQTLITIPACETYENILTGDLVVQDDSNTSVKTVFNIDGSKKVCVLTGSAHIVR